MSRGRGYSQLLARLAQLTGLGVDLGLERVTTALARLGAPERQVVAVQIAGTNGKGSTAAMTDAILRAAGLKVGLFTSPHLCRFTERIRIDGAEVDGDHLADLDRRVVATGVPLTYFEVSTALAFLAMAEAGVEVAVLETGLGGRLDATTACHPSGTAITTIAMDHAELLGGTLAAIAREKAGIAKPGVPLLLGPLPPEAEAEIVAAAARIGAPVRRYGIDFTAPETAPALAGPHQRSNAALARELAFLAAARLGRVVGDAEVAAGLRAVRWPGRLERLDDHLVLDCAHNLEGAASLATALSAESTPRVLVLSVVRGKDLRGIADALVPGFDRVIATRSRNPRALPPEEIARAVAQVTAPPPIETAEDPTQALATARRWARDGLVVVAGSTFLVGAVRAALLGEPCDDTSVSDPMP